jgi:hypothetical protein
VHALRACALKANTRRGSGGKSRKYRTRNTDLVVTITQNKIRRGCKSWNGNFVITICKRVSHGRGRRPYVVSYMQTRNGYLVITHQFWCTRRARHLVTTTGIVGPRQRPGKGVSPPDAALPRICINNASIVVALWLAGHTNHSRSAGNVSCRLLLWMLQFWLPRLQTAIIRFHSVFTHRAARVSCDSDERLLFRVLCFLIFTPLPLICSPSTYFRLVSVADALSGMATNQFSSSLSTSRKTDDIVRL